MALDHKLRNQLIEARENISAQLEQLERGGPGILTGSPILATYTPICNESCTRSTRFWRLLEIRTSKQRPPTRPWSNAMPTEPSAIR